MNGKIDHFIAVSEHDFDAVNVDELSFKRGQRIIVAPKGKNNYLSIKYVFVTRFCLKYFFKEYQPKLRGWLLGTIDGKTQGIMPANYLKILGKKIGENSKPKTTANTRLNEENSNLI